MEISTRNPRAGRGRRLLVNAFSAIVTIGALLFILPTALGYERFLITGSSMSGTFEVGSLVFSEVVPVGQLHEGDIITYMPPASSGIHELVTHRIVKIKKDGSFRTKGDAVSNVDPWTFKLAGDNQPRAAFSVPYVGWVFLALQDRTIRIALIALPASVIALRALLQIVSILRRRGGPGATPSTTLPADQPVPATLSG